MILQHAKWSEKVKSRYLRSNYVTFDVVLKGLVTLFLADYVICKVAIYCKLILGMQIAAKGLSYVN